MNNRPFLIPYQVAIGALSAVVLCSFFESPVSAQVFGGVTWMIAATNIASFIRYALERTEEDKS